MKRKIITALFSIVLLAASIILADDNSAQQKEIWVLEYDGVINPVAASYIGDNIYDAEKSGVECLILKMDT
ncbi:hypothetical protein KKA87_00325, partial [bacterium]|nr:hypothetical protein [bacterium]